MPIPIVRILCVFLSCLILLTVPGLGAERATIQDYTPWKDSDDPVAQLWKDVTAGKVRLDLSGEKPFIQSLLKALDVPVESQVLVFSKTSLQNALIGPTNPRAIYFNEECYVGWVRGGAIELIGMDSKVGPQFYVLDMPTDRNTPPPLSPSEQCLSCHEGSRTGRVKGMLVRSVFADPRGLPLLRHGSFVTGHESPLSERWGGWYVTGSHGSEQHMGNVTAEEQGDDVLLNRQAGANVTSLEKFISTEPYLAATSDILALMILEHQCTMHNLLTAATKAVSEAQDRQRVMNEAFGSTDSEMGTSLKTVLQNQTNLVLQHLLFSREYALQDGGVVGGDAFQDAFRRQRRDSSTDRSLKDFQLRTRMFKYRCSYMIYSKSFEGLPPLLKKEIFTRLDAILKGRDTAPEYSHLAESEREEIRRILLETLPEAKAAWVD